MPKKNFHYKRPVNKRPSLPIILVVCEGGTETNYFNGMRKRERLFSVHVEGAGKQKLSLVNIAEKYAEDRKRKGQAPDEVWCVFDRDKIPNDDFIKACARAKELGYKIATSNPRFEIWVLAHFQLVQTGLDSKQLDVMLNKALKKHGLPAYKKPYPGIYHDLSPFTKTAVDNCKKVLHDYGNVYSNESSNPSTEVHKLLIRLLALRNSNK